MKQKTGCKKKWNPSVLWYRKSLSLRTIKAVNVVIDQLNNDRYDLMKRTKLCLKDIYELAVLCLSKCFFLWSGETRILKNSGPIGLSFMFALSESYVQNLEYSRTWKWRKMF